MTDFSNLFKSDDWKKEKHIPVIEAPVELSKGEICKVKISVGKAIPHPNNTSHHIKWIAAFFLPENEKFPYQLARAEFAAHGESTEGADTSTVYTEPDVFFNFKTEKSGTIFASSYCNIHGLWQSSHVIKCK